MSLGLLLLIGGVLVLAAVGVVRTPNLVHSVFSLAAALIATSALYVLLGAPFLAGIQIILYTGGVITLMLFGVMLTQRDASVGVPNPVQRELQGLTTAAVLLVLLLSGIWGTPELVRAVPLDPVSTLAVGEVFLTQQLLAFEVLSMLLLAALIGAIVLVRKVDP
jgi:NADH-quinone oxidoreductase subunit J